MYTRVMMLKHEIHNQRKKMTDNSFQMILRVTMQLCDSALGQVGSLN